MPGNLPEVDGAGVGEVTAVKRLRDWRSGDMASGRSAHHTAHRHLVNSHWCQALLWTLGPPECVGLHSGGGGDGRRQLSN